MELGYFTMPLHPPGSNITQTPEDDLERMVTLDRLGYKEAWIGRRTVSALPVRYGTTSKITLAVIPVGVTKVALS